ncbi:unnamed protein product, partial [Meganyctiphanes norvegica]
IQMHSLSWGVATQRLQCFKVHRIWISIQISLSLVNTLTFGLSSKCILFLGELPPKDCNVSRFIASGFLSKFPRPWSTSLTFGRLSTYVGIGRPYTFIVSGVLSDMFEVTSVFGSRVALSFEHLL